MAITPSSNTNTFRLKNGSDFYETTIVPEEYGGMDSYIEQREGWLPTCARCFLTQEQLNDMPDGVQEGRTPVSIYIGGNASVSDAIRVATISGGSATPIPTATIFYVWKFWSIKAGSNLTLYEMELRTYQQWWDAIPISKAYNALNLIRTAFTTEESCTGSYQNWSAVFNDIFSASGVTSITVANAPSSYSPLDFRLRNIPLSVALRRVCNGPRMVLQHDIYTDTFVVNKVTQPTPTSWLPYILNGDKLINKSQSELVPDTLLFVSPNPGGGFVTSAVSRSTGYAQGPSGSSMPFHIGDYFTQPTYASGQSTPSSVATELGSYYYSNATVARERYLFAGHVYPLVPTAPAIYMHPGIRYRKVSLACDGLTTLIETGPVDPYLSDDMYTRNGVPQTSRQLWRADGGIDTQEPSQKFKGKLGVGTLLSGEVMKWDYPFTKMKPTTTVAATPRWVVDTVSPLTDATTGSSKARNDNEDNNPASITGTPTITGTGVLVSTGVPSCLMQPMGAGAVVDMTVSYLPDGTASFSFSEPNTFQ